MTQATLGAAAWSIKNTLIIASAPEPTWMTLQILETAALPTQDSASAVEIILMSLVKVRLLRICSY